MSTVIKKTQIKKEKRMLLSIMDKKILKFSTDFKHAEVASDWKKNKQWDIYITLVLKIMRVHSILSILLKAVWYNIILQGIYTCCISIIHYFCIANSQ